MPECRVCYKEILNPSQPCTRCGFLQPSIIGDANAAEAFIQRKARNHQLNFLNGFDFGITVYYWKDQNGQVVLDREERLSFGKGGSLLNNTLWLEQCFARIPDTQEMELELSVVEQEGSPRKFTVKMPVPQGKHLQQVGITLTDDMAVYLQLKNPEGQTESSPILFLGE